MEERIGKDRAERIKETLHNLYFGTTYEDRFSEEEIKKIKEKQSKKIVQFDMEGNIITIWNSRTELAKRMNVSISYKIKNNIKIKNLIFKDYAFCIKNNLLEK